MSEQIADKFIKMKNERIYIRVTDQFKTDLEKVSEAAGQKSSQIVREAIDEKLEKLKEEPRIAKKLNDMAVAA